MSRRLACYALPLILAGLIVGGPALYAQDAGMALRASVSYNTQRASLPLSGEQRSEAARLGQEAQQAAQAGNYREAMRDYHQGTAVMRNIAWTPSYELAASLEAHLDHAMAEPGKTVTVTLNPLYTAERARGLKVTASVHLLPAKPGADASGDTTLASGLALDPAALPFHTSVTLPDSPGDFRLEVRLAPEGETPGDAARAAFVKRLPLHVESLAREAQLLREKLAKTKKGPELPTAEYALALYQRADDGDLNPASVNFHDEFAKASAIADSLNQGRDPFVGRHGDLHKAYRSAVDNTLQPYRLFIPAAYDGAKPTPLVVALHGMGGDENSMFDSYGQVLKREAERLGFLVAAPKGRDTASMYRGSAEQDVVDVLSEVERDYRVDRKRVYLMGHSMGGYGTWSVAFAHPELFAALGPISGGGDPSALVKIKNIPVFVVHGDDDRTVNVSQSRRMVEAGKKIGMNVVYIEVPGGSHTSVAAPNFAPMLDFFAKQQRSDASAAKAP